MGVAQSSEYLTQCRPAPPGLRQRAASPTHRRSAPPAAPRLHTLPVVPPLSHACSSAATDPGASNPTVAALAPAACGVPPEDVLASLAVAPAAPPAAAPAPYACPAPATGFEDLGVRCAMPMAAMPSLVGSFARQCTLTMEPSITPWRAAASPVRVAEQQGDEES